MSELKATPGPWEAVNYGDIYTRLGAPSGDGVTSDDTDGWHIASVGDAPTLCDGEYMPLGIEVRRANARLIAAAPDMYALLDRLFHECSDDLSGFAEMEIGNVLKKARGES